MMKIWIIARKDIGEAFRSRSTYLFTLVMLILSISFISGYRAHVKTLTNPQAIDAFSRSFLNGLAYILPMMYSIFVCSIFANYSVIIDKANRNIESLMATPVSMNQVWMGKSLAVTLPSTIIGIGVSIVGYLVMSVGFVIPNTHSFIFPSAPAIISAILLAPILVFSIVTIVINIQLNISNPRIANFVFTGIFVLLILGLNALGGLGISMSLMPFIYLGVLALCTGVSFVLYRSLNKERVLLSTKV